MLCRIDGCSLCGQCVIYQDETIAGESFQETIEEVERVARPARDIAIVDQIVRLGTLGELPPDTTTPAEVVALFRGCTPTVAERLEAAIRLVRDLRFVAPVIAARGGAWNWPKTIAMLTGWTEERAQEALDAAARVGRIGATGAVNVRVDGEIQTLDVGKMPDA
jgi:hypothetical protein